MKVLLILIWAINGLDLSLAKDIYELDENWICNVKTSCVECLRLTHCSWCSTENKCFSKNLPTFQGFCVENSTDHEDYGFSLEDNARCACGDGKLERNCYPSGVTEGPECAGRGSCVCGRCVCDLHPDPLHSEKTVMGEFCEFDNFSCDGPKCNEGPYSLSQTENEDLEDF